MLLLGLVVSAWLTVPTAAAGQEAAISEPAIEDETSADAQEADAPGTEPTRTAALSLVVSPVVGDGADDGDLVADPETGLPTLTFSPTSPAEQTAVHDFTVTNTGDVALYDVAITDERIGAVLDASRGTTLEPGASTTVRAAAAFTFEEAIAGTAGLITTPAEATASTEATTEVTAAAESTIQVVAVLPTPAASIDLEALVGVGGVETGVGGMPTVSWTAQEAAVGDERTIHYRLTITNTGDAELVGVAAVVDVLGSRLTATADGTTLAPGETVTVEVSRTLTPDEMGGDPADGVEVRAAADLQAADSMGQAVSAADEAVVLGVVVAPDELDQEQVLPSAGPRDDSSDLLVVAVLLLLLGADLLWITRPRRVVAGRPPPRPAAASSRRG